MKKKTSQILYIIGIIALIIGAIDPLEGSVVIAGGSVLIVIAAYLLKDTLRKLFLTSMIMILIGVFTMFYLSSLGGIGGSSSLSMYWGLTILPYLIGWLIAIISIIYKIVRRSKNKKINLKFPA